MSVAMRKPMTLEEFLAWEEGQELRWEFDGFAPVAMTGGTVEQGLIQANLIRALGNRLHGGPCRVLGSHVKIAVAGSIKEGAAFPGRKFERLGEQRPETRGIFVIHRCFKVRSNHGTFSFSRRASQARAHRQSRFRVLTETPMTSAVSTAESPV